MKLTNERGVIYMWTVILFVCSAVGLFKGVEHMDRNVTNKDKYATSEPYFIGGTGDPRSVREWREKGWREKEKLEKELKIEANALHDANALPPGYRVDTEYKDSNKEGA